MRPGRVHSGSSDRSGAFPERSGGEQVIEDRAASGTGELAGQATGSAFLLPGAAVTAWPGCGQPGSAAGHLAW